MESTTQKSEPEYTKVDDSTLKIEYTETQTIVTPKTETLDYDFLLGQEAQINEQRDIIKANIESELANNEDARKREIADVKARLAICEAQGLKTKAEIVKEAEAARLAAEQAEVGELQDAKEPIIP